jgi:DNA-binding NarL/FixJ family response regulator
MQGSAKERLNISAKNKVKALLVMILIVTFEHTFTMINYFSKSWTGTMANVGLVIWIDLMMFFCLDLIQSHASTTRKVFGWTVFISVVVISGFLNIFYMMHHSPDEFSQIISMILSFMIGGVAPLSIVFLGMVYSESSQSVIHLQSKRMNDENTVPKEPKPEKIVQPKINRKEDRNHKVIELHQQGVNKSEIARRLDIHRNTVNSILKESGYAVS